MKLTLKIYEVKLMDDVVSFQWLWDDGEKTFINTDIFYFTKYQAKIDALKFIENIQKGKYELEIDDKEVE